MNSQHNIYNIYRPTSYYHQINPVKVIEINATVEIEKWEEKRSFLVEKKSLRQNGSRKDRLRRVFRQEELDHFRKLIKSQVQFFKHGSPNFACGRKEMV